MSPIGKSTEQEVDLWLSEPVGRGDGKWLLMGVGLLFRVWWKCFRISDDSHIALLETTKLNILRVRCVLEGSSIDSVHCKEEPGGKTIWGCRGYSGGGGAWKVLSDPWCLFSSWCQSLPVAKFQWDPARLQWLMNKWQSLVKNILFGNNFKQQKDYRSLGCLSPGHCHLAFDWQLAFLQSRERSSPSSFLLWFG